MSHTGLLAASSPACSLMPHFQPIFNIFYQTAPLMVVCPEAFSSELASDVGKESQVLKIGDMTCCGLGLHEYL